jgi:hypothetical protein
VDSASTPYSSRLATPGFGVGTVDHRVPSHRMARELVGEPLTPGEPLAYPTAQASVDDVASMP